MVRLSKFFKSFVWNALIAAAILWGAHWWQTRNLLPANGEIAAPYFRLVDMDGMDRDLSTLTGRNVVLYFMAPWCSVCHASIDNLQAIRSKKSHEELAIWIIALDYQDKSEVATFLEKHQLDIPVLLGTTAVHSDYKITAFPTYYILDKQGRIRSHVVGYSTETGLRLRLL